MTSIAALPSKIETETMRRITWRILPFFMLCYFIAYVDRVNAGFAATAAAGIAGINTLSHIGTSGAVWLLGVIKEATGSFPLALIPLAVLQIAGIIAVLWINKQETLPATTAASPVH